MKTVFLLFAIASVCAGAEWDSFQVTYGPAGSGEGYYGMPWTVKEATAQGKWEKIGEDRHLNVEVYSQHNDPRVMLLFDKNGNIAGIRTAFLKDDVAAKAKAGGYKFDFDYDNKPMYDRGTYFGKQLWYASVLFASPSKLAAGGRRPLNKQTDDVAEGLYFKGNGQWIELKRDECSQTREFTEANCFPGMGKHYFYKMYENDCKRRQPFFSLYDNGKLIGFGLAGYGSYSKSPNTQNYYEDFSVAAARSIIPNGPKCIEEYINKYGLTQMHVYLKKNASKLSCPAKDWRSGRC